MRLFTERSARKRIVEPAGSKKLNFRRLSSGGLLGFSGVCFSQMIGIAHPDTALEVALYAFILAIPLLAKDLVDAQAEEEHGIVVDLPSRVPIIFLGALASMTGIAAIGYHFSFWLGFLFTVACWWSMHSHVSYLDKLSEEAVRHPDMSPPTSQHAETEDPVS